MCYDIPRGDPMENEQNIQLPEEGYVPRPRGQVWAARIGVALVVVLVILYYITIARGGA